MLRRQFLAATAAQLAAQTAARRPNVIVVLTDDQGYGDLSAHGNPRLKTPNIDRLHGESVRLTDFHVAPMCTPTRSQLMTGRDALMNGAMNVSSGRTLLRTDLPTMPEMFAASGYRTGIFGKWHLGDSYPYRPEDRGFQEALWFPSSHVGSASDAWDNDYFNDRYRRNGKLERYRGYCTDVFFDEAIAWMRRQQGPFFTYLPTNAPHGPLFVDERYRKQFADLPRPLASFFGMITNIDENMGKLERFLVEAGLRDNTILMFMTDNGGTAGVDFYNAGMRGRKITLWEGGHRVPCFVRWPAGSLGGAGKSREVNELTQVQDVLPTLASLCGVAAPPEAKFDGRDLSALLHGRTAELPDRMFVIQFSRMNVGRPQWGDACVLWDKWRLVNNDSLYDVAKDPAQKKNVIAENPSVAAKMRAHYDEWWKNVDPRLDSFLPIHIGAPEENPTLASPTEWADSFLDQGTQIRRGIPRNGHWHVMVEHPGEYTFRLRRWPAEVDVAMRAGLPAHDGEDGGYPAGVALPIAQARLVVGAADLAKPVGAEDREAVFTLRLAEGWTKMQTWFYDAEGKELSGAYFVIVERKP